MAGVFSNYPAQVVRNTSAEREMVMMRWATAVHGRAACHEYVNQHESSYIDAL